VVFGNTNTQKTNFICRANNRHFVGRTIAILFRTTYVLDNDDKRTNGVILCSIECFSFPLLYDYTVLASVPNTWSFRKVKCLHSVAQSDHVQLLVFLFLFSPRLCRMGPTLPYPGIILERQSPRQ